MSPILGALLYHYFGQNFVFFLGPGTLSKVAAVDELKPSCVALDFRLALKQFADSVPAVLAKFFNIFEKFGILIKLKRTKFINAYDKTYLLRRPLDAVLGVALPA